MQNEAQMKAAVEDILATLNEFEGESALTAAYTVVAYLILSDYPTERWGERIAWVQQRIPVVFQGLIDEMRKASVTVTRRLPQ